MTTIRPALDVPPELPQRVQASADLAVTRTPKPPTTLEAAQAAFKALTSSTSLEISSFHDEATGRYVVRVADRGTGRVLIQTPPDALLRFLASAPSLDPPPTLIDA